MGRDGKYSDFIASMECHFFGMAYSIQEMGSLIQDGHRIAWLPHIMGHHVSQGVTVAAGRVLNTVRHRLKDYGFRPMLIMC